MLITQYWLYACWTIDTILSRKYHAIVYNTHAWFAAQNSQKTFVIDREYGTSTLRERHLRDREDRTAPQTHLISPEAGKYIDRFLDARSIYDRIMPRKCYIHVERCYIYIIWCNTMVYCKNIAQFHVMTAGRYRLHFGLPSVLTWFLSPLWFDSSRLAPNYMTYFETSSPTCEDFLLLKTL